VLAGLGDHAIGLRLRIGEQPVGFGPRVVDQRIRLGRRRRHHGAGVLFGLAEQCVASIEHVLGVVEFARNRVLDVIDQLEDITAGHHAAGRHGHTARFFNNGAQLIERFKYSVHGTPSRRS
jgi:hypothetical protein